jgi:hypothetical protein
MSQRKETMIPIPFFQTPAVDCAEALMSFDREMCAEHAIFAREFNRADIDGVDVENLPDDFDHGTNTTVVEEIAPGVRIRHFMRIAWVRRARDGRPPGAPGGKDFILLSGEDHP